MLILSIVFIYTMNYVKTDSFSCIYWWFTEEEENLLLSVVIICIIAITKSHNCVAGLHSDINCANQNKKLFSSPKAIESRWKQVVEAEGGDNIDQQDKP